MGGKIEAHHLERQAYVYVRQSTTRQVLENAESTARQYALADRAAALGWTRESICIIDSDLGHSGTSIQGRIGFHRLTEAVARGEAGAIFAIEVSRLARSSQDWQRLLSLCAVARVVVVDEQSTYDPNGSDDKLLLDFKGTMSEAELHWLRLRLRGAQISLAKRGELRISAPTGYVWGRRGLEKDPDEAVRSAIGLIFERFPIEPTAGALLRWAHGAGFEVPTRRCFSDGTSELSFGPLYASRLKDILRSPIYAGAYAYGRRCQTKAIIDGEIHTACRTKAPEEWTALIQDAHEGYVSWETYLSNQERMRENAARRPNKGAPREGQALLVGVLLCGLCGRRMRVGYTGSSGKRYQYVCVGAVDRGTKACWTVSGPAIDAAVEDLLLRMIVPSELELSLAVEREVEAQAASLRAQWKLRLEKAEYEARRAERRYKAVDPENRVVARSLEADWESCLRELEAVRGEYESARRARHVELSDEDRRRIRELARDLPSVWRAPTTKPVDRKAMLRLAIEAITITPIDLPERMTRLQVQWRSGAVDELRVARRRSTLQPCEAVDRVCELAATGVRDVAVAAQLNAEHMPTGRMGHWTTQAVKKVRLKHTSIRRAPTSDRRLPDQHPDGRYTITGAMKRFGVGEEKVRSWIRRGLVKADLEEFAWSTGAYLLRIDQATATRLAEDAKKRRKTTAGL